MLHKFVRMIYIIIEVNNYKLMKNRRKRFFSSITNDSLSKILLTIISSYSYFKIILDSFLNRNLHLKLLKRYSSTKNNLIHYLFSDSENCR